MRLSLKFSLPIAIIAFSINAGAVFAYGQNSVHPALTDATARLYNSKSPNSLSEQDITWLKEGSASEDNGVRWLNHAYDPIYNRTWNYPKPFAVLNLFDNTAKNWAQNENAQIAYGNERAYILFDPVSKIASIFTGDKNMANNQTWQRALYEYARGNRQGAMFALGHVLHLIQDMTVPAHTRANIHISYLGDMATGYYERYADRAITQLPEILRDLSDVIKPSNSIYSLDDYFDENARYSNNYFYSEDTIRSSEYRLPDPQYDRSGGRYVLGLDENRNLFKLAFRATDFRVIGGPDTLTLDNDAVLQDYWSRLSRKAILSGAGVIDLFFREAEELKRKAEADPKLLADMNRSWLERQVAAVNDFFSTVFALVRPQNETAYSSPIPVAVVSSPLPILSPIPSPRPSPTRSPTATLPVFSPQSAVLHSPLPSPNRIFAGTAGGRRGSGGARAVADYIVDQLPELIPSPNPFPTLEVQATPEPSSSPEPLSSPEPSPMPYTMSSGPRPPYIIIEQPDGSVSTITHTALDNNYNDITVASQVFTPVVSGYLSAIEVYTADFQSWSLNPYSNTCYLRIFEHDTDTLLARSDNAEGGYGCTGAPRFTFENAFPWLEAGKRYRWDFVFGLQNNAAIRFLGSTVDTVGGLFTFRHLNNFDQPVVNAKFTAYAKDPIPLVTSMEQLRADGLTLLPEGGSAAESAVVLRVGLASASVNPIKLEIEVRPTDEDFENEPTLESRFVTVSDGEPVTFYIGVPTLSDGSYHWQARAVHQNGFASDWREFGLVGNTDFQIRFQPIPDVLAQQTSGSIMLASGTGLDNNHNNIVSASQEFVPDVSGQVGSIEVFTANFVSGWRWEEDDCYLRLSDAETDGMLAESDNRYSGQSCAGDLVFTFGNSRPELEAGARYRWEFVWGMQNFAGVDFYGAPYDVVGGWFDCPVNEVTGNAKFIVRRAPPQEEWGSP